MSNQGNHIQERWHVHAVRLPDGDTPEDWWIADGNFSTTPFLDARELSGGWFLPGGLVDAHAHLTMNFNNHPFADGSDALIDANLAVQRAAGVLAVRDAGLAWGGRAYPTPAEGPYIQSAGRLLAAPGRGYPNICAWVEPDRLVEVALDDVRRGASWIKIMGDFPGPDGNWFAAPPVYPAELVRALVQAVHAAGARVMAHSTGIAAGDLVRAEVDSIEHGMQLNRELLEIMAHTGAAWTLTLSTAHKHVGPIAAQQTPVGAYIRAELARLRDLLPFAAAIGVTLLAGTDELPHGALAQELALLQEYGLTPSQAIAVGSTTARAYLGLPGLAAGAPADLVMFSADPRNDPAVLAQPGAVLFHGRLIQ